MADKNFKARIGIEAPRIAAENGTTAITLTGADIATAGNVSMVGDLTVSGNDIKSSGGATAITMSSANVQIQGDLTVNGNDIKGSGGITAITMSGADVAVAGDLTVNDAVIFDGATSGTVTVAAPAVAGTQSYTLPTAQPPVSGYVLSSTTGGAMSWVPNSDANTTYTVNASSVASGANLNLVGSDATTDSVAYLGAGATTVSRTDANTITVTSTDTNTTYTQNASSVTGGAGLNLVGSDSTTDTVEFKGSGAATVTRTDANTVTIAATDTNTTYDFAATSTSGGANLNLSGSDTTTDTVKIASGTGVTVAQVNSTEVSVAIGQSVATSADVTFNTVNANITDDNYVLGQLYATRNTAYVPPATPLSTLAGQNGLVVSSSSGGLGFGVAVAVRYHSGDTTAGVASAAGLVLSGASGTNSAPGGATSNQVLGGVNFDGYTAGTSNNYASVIAGSNSGGTTTGISPLQAQGYARQAFVNSVTVSTAVTGASGTGSVATLTFATQNTAPYAVGQTVTVAGMTPSGYNGTVVITAATTSSISYANATTGFTSGGTIAAGNTVTAAGMGFRIRGFANSTPMSVANRFSFMDLTASNANFKSAAYTFANDVITGSTLTAANYMTLGATTGSVNQDTFTLRNTAGTTTYATVNSTSATLNGDTVNLRNTAGTTTYVNATATGTIISGAGLSTVTRTTVGTPGSPEARPSMNIQLIRSDQAAPNDSDGTSFRSRVGGSNGTFYTISDIGAAYKTSGDVQFNVNLANGDQTGATFSSLNTFSSSITITKIKAGTASGTAGGSAVADVAIFTPANNTLRADALTLTNYAAAPLTGDKIAYNRVFGQFELTTTTTPAAANTAAVFALGTATVNNIATVGSTSRLIPGAAGFYNFAFSVQAQNSDNANDHDLYIWLRKNGSDVVGSTGRYTLSKSTSGSLKILGWNFVVQSANATDYFELAYAVDSTQITFPAFAALAFAPSTASLVTTLTPVGA